MAVIKHIAIKNSNYDAATDYLTTQHDEFTNKAILDEAGNPIPRDSFLIEGINCNYFTFGRECEATNALFHKNQQRDEIKAHHYIISFDPRDRDENNLTLEQAQKLAVDFAKKNFPGHQMIVCAHPDGHNSAGNIHVHIVINSVRKLTVEKQDFMERDGDALAGHKHHVTDKYLAHLKQQVMTMCQDNSLYQVDLLNPARIRITDREYWAQRKGQTALDDVNKDKVSKGEPVTGTTFKTDKQILREAISSTLSDSHSYEDFCKKLFEKYGIEVNESRGRISYLPQCRSKPIRGRQLGADFEKEHLLEVIAEQAKEKNIEEPLKASIKYQSSGIKLITDLERCAKAQQNLYYARKVKISNLQKMSDTLAFLKENGISSIEELDKLLTATSSDVSQSRKTLKSTESRLAQINMLIKYTGQYLANKDIYLEYLNATNKRVFREDHRAEITLYEAARKYMQENAPEKSKDPKTGKIKFKCPSIKSLKAEKEKLLARKNQQYEEYSYSRAKYRELQTVSENVHSMLQGVSKEKTKEKGGQSL